MRLARLHEILAIPLRFARKPRRILLPQLHPNNESPTEIRTHGAAGARAIMPRIGLVIFPQGKIKKNDIKIHAVSTLRGVPRKNGAGPGAGSCRYAAGPGAEC